VPLYSFDTQMKKRYTLKTLSAGARDTITVKLAAASISSAAALNLLGFAIDSISGIDNLLIV
jgi:hypothetical protein